MKYNCVAHIIGAVARTLLGAVFVFSGFVKAVDPLGTTYKIEDYLHAFGGFFTQLDVLAGGTAVVLIAFEFLLGFCLLFNIRTRWTSWLALVMMVFMTPLTLYIAIENPVSDCGCFGDAIVLSNWATFWKNIVLLVLVIVLLGTRKHIPQFFTGKAELGIFAVGTIALTTIMLVSRLSLPFIDFRPYKIGNHIPTLMEYPEDAEADVYETTFTYEKDGVEQEFTLENYPKDDSTWVFVRQNTTLIQKGYEPPIHDFEIMNMDYEDITEALMTHIAPVTFIIMYDLAKADTTQVKKMEAMWARNDDECMWIFEDRIVDSGTDNLDSLLAVVANEYPQVFFLTGSTYDEIDAFCEQHFSTFEEMRYYFCSVDPVTLKTIVRANPGVMVVQEGTIIDKYNLRNKKVEPYIIN